jgi:stress response protein SCP2
MAISLKKGQGVSLKKTENDLSMVTIGLGWDVVEKKTGLLSGLFGKKEPDYDLDVVAFLCAADGKVKNLGIPKGGRPSLEGGDVVFFNSMRHNSGHIWVTGDNRTGAGDGDDEQIIVKLNELSADYHKIVFVVQIYQGIANKQSFGEVSNAFIRAEDAKGKEMLRFDLSGGAQYQNCRSLLFAELVRDGGDWKFNAIGAPALEDTFVHWLKQYA